MLVNIFIVFLGNLLPPYTSETTLLHQHLQHVSVLLQILCESPHWGEPHLHLPSELQMQENSYIPSSLPPKVHRDVLHLSL